MASDVRKRPTTQRLGMQLPEAVHWAWSDPGLRRRVGDVSADWREVGCAEHG